MTYKYVNRKNLVFYLNIKKDLTGNIEEYFFSRNTQKNEVNEIPEGYEIFEDPQSAKVSLRKK
ncbi:MAG: hypothetical protein U0457_02145 [Candidatus Sericytochromatia bacterium]